MPSGNFEAQWPESTLSALPINHRMETVCRASFVDLSISEWVGLLSFGCFRFDLFLHLDLDVCVAVCPQWQQYAMVHLCVR